jgi:geranylgeranyl diphosphate synthase type I
MDVYSDHVLEQIGMRLTKTSADLNNVMQYHFGWMDQDGQPAEAVAGKCLRPTLCLFFCDILGGDWRKAMPAAVAIELIHNFSLIHDDIQDEDTKRHNRSTVWHIWGKPKGILAGDAMRILADASLHGLEVNGFGPSKIKEVSFLLTERYLEMLEGQHLDLKYENSLEVTLGQYIDMISRKTGSLIEASTQLGAILASDGCQYEEEVAKFGRSLGLGFQIRDDVLGIWGSQEITGKAVGNDILRKKKTFPIVYALEVSPKNLKDKIKEIYKKKILTKDDVNLVMEILDDLGACQYSQTVAEQMCSEAVEASRRIRISQYARNDIDELASFIALRNN